MLESIRELVDVECIAMMERMARTILKLSGMPNDKRLDDFYLGWNKGGMPTV